MAIIVDYNFRLLVAQLAACKSGNMFRQRFLISDRYMYLKPKLGLDKFISRCRPIYNLITSLAPFRASQTAVVHTGRLLISIVGLYRGRGR